MPAASVGLTIHVDKKGITHFIHLTETETRTSAAAGLCRAFRSVRGVTLGSTLIARNRTSDLDDSYEDTIAVDRLGPFLAITKLCTLVIRKCDAGVRITDVLIF